MCSRSSAGRRDRPPEVVSPLMLALTTVGADVLARQALLEQRDPAAAARRGRTRPTGCRRRPGSLRVAADGAERGHRQRAPQPPRGPRYSAASQRRRVHRSSQNSTTFMSEPIIAVERLTKQVQDSTGTLTILHEIDFTLPPRRSVAIVGASGSGKSTLLSIIAGLDTPTTGTVRLAGIDLFAIDEDARAAVRARQGRLRVPELPAARQPERARERDAAARAAGPRDARVAGDRDAASRRPGRAAAPLSAGAVGRRAAARRAGARLRRPAGACCWPTSRPAASTSPPARP